jgi:site-specific recombinase XerD
MEHRRSQLRMGRRLKIMQQQVGHSWASTTAVYTTVGADARNRMLRAALARAFDGDRDGY